MQGGLFSRRRKPTGGGGKKPPLLPTNASSSYKSNFSPMGGYAGPSSQRRMRNTMSSSGGSDTCSSFVFGGSYYPGKDKRRTRGLGYRIFCSSIPRSILFSALIGYGAVRYVLSPIGGLILGLGTILATDPDSNRGLGMPWGDDDVLRKMLPSLEVQRAVELERMEGEEHEGRVIGKLMLEQLEVLKGIVPDWATRNIVFGSNDYDEEGSEDGDGASRESADAEPHDEPSNDEDPFLRTLQRMDTSQTCTEAWPTNPSISLVMQSTLDRLWLLEETCKRWTDPIIVVVYYDALSDVNTDTAAVDASEHELAHEPWLPILDWTNRCPQVTFIPFSKQDPTEESWQYPINKLRNVGLDNIETTHFLVVDIDFIPSSNLPYVIKENLKHVTGERDALVIPAFERVTPRGCSKPSECRSFLREDTSFIPSTFDELKACHDAKDCIVFQSRNNWEGHFTTNSESWLRNENAASGPPRRISCFHSFRYEPYVVLRYCDNMTPLYDERFYGYGKNKIEYISHLRFLNYGFRILPEGFIVHHPHPESDAKSSWNDSEGFDLHSKMDQLYPTFLKELYDRYGKPDLPQCQHKKNKV